MIPLSLKETNMPITVIPVHDNILLEPKQDTGMRGALFVPEHSKVKLSQGIVLAKGDLCTDLFKVGDEIHFAKHSEVELDVDGKKYNLVPESAVLCKIERRTDSGIISLEFK